FPSNLLVFKSSMMISRTKLDGLVVESAGVVSRLDVLIGSFYRGTRIAAILLCHALCAQLLNGLIDPLEAGIPAQHHHGLKQRRGILPAAYRDANGLEHLAGFHSQTGGRGAQRLFERLVTEFDRRQNLARRL